ncbi:MAG: DNA recombination protein RmuC [Pseudomonadota bacterium]
MSIEVLIAALVLLPVLILLWQVMQLTRQQAQIRDALLRQETRMDEQGRRAEALGQQSESRARNVEEVVRQLDQHLRDGHAAAQQQQLAAMHQLQETLLERFASLQQGLERRLGEALGAQADMAGQLREILLERFEALQKAVASSLNDGHDGQQQALAALREQLQAALAANQNHFEIRQGEALKILQDSLRAGMELVQRQVAEALARNAEELGKRVEGLTQTTDSRLQEISGQVERRLSEGFEKTTATFADVVKRLALIDEAQKKITELSGNVISLQEVLTDKRSRGAFGEVQLYGLIRNVLPESSFAVQHTLKNGTRVDCILFLPEPTGHVAIDAKFPLESYRRMTDIHLPESERKQAERQFKVDIRKHIQDVAGKYIIPGHTADGAVMFIPAEAIFAEIHAHHPDLVEEAHRTRVWLCSPTTLMAILSTARAVLKDAATRQQVHVIQEHLAGLSKDFKLFQQRMDALANHIRQANQDIDQVGISAKKISKRFQKIEQVELEDLARAHLTVVHDGTGED